MNGELTKMAVKNHIICALFLVTILLEIKLLIVSSSNKYMNTGVIHSQHNSLFFSLVNGPLELKKLWIFVSRESGNPKLIVLILCWHEEFCVYLILSLQKDTGRGTFKKFPLIEKLILARGVVKIARQLP